MKIINFLLCISLVIKFSNCTYAQLDKFYVGIYTMDFNNPVPLPGCPIHSTNANPKSHDFNYLNSLQKDNFNLIIPWVTYLKPQLQYVSTSPDTSFLTICKNLGISVIITAPENHVRRVGSSALLIPPIYNQNLSNACLNYYGNHPAVIGWHISDEPGHIHFNDINNFTNDVKNIGKLPYLNLLPTYASLNQLNLGQWAGYTNSSTLAEYENYIVQYINLVNPTMLGVDNYVDFSSNKTDLFANLEIIRKHSTLNNIPFIWVITPVDVWSNCGGQASISNSRYKIFSPLIYGAKGLSYWTRETMFANPYLGGNWWDEIAPTEKSFLRDLHGRLIKNSSILMAINIEGVYHKSNISTFNANYNDDILPNNTWSQLNSSPLVNSIFTTMKKGPFSAISGSSIEPLVFSVGQDINQNKYFWVFNKSLTNTIEFFPHFNPALFKVILYEVLDETFCFSTAPQSIRLEPGEGKLFRVDLFNMQTMVCGNINTSIKAPGAITLGCTTNSSIVSSSNLNFTSATNIRLQNRVLISNNTLLKVASSCVGQTYRMSPFEPEVFNDNEDILVYPNPSQGNFIIDTKSINPDLKEVIVNIVDTKGSSVFTTVLANNEQQISVNLTQGVYILYVNTSEKKFVKKIIITY